MTSAQSRFMHAWKRILELSVGPAIMRTIIFKPIPEILIIVEAVRHMFDWIVGVLFLAQLLAKMNHRNIHHAHQISPLRVMIVKPDFYTFGNIINRIVCVF